MPSMSADRSIRPDGVPPRPNRLEVQSGSRPHTEFGHDDVDADAELVVVRTSDGRHWDGLHMRPRTETPGRAGTLVLIVHGSMGSYLGGVPRQLAFELVHHGFPVMSVNTRMANFGVVYGGGLFEETPHDLDGAMDLARERGWTKIVLLGYSLGATMVTHYQALRQPAEVVGICTLAHPWSLPESIRRRWTANGAQPSYTEMERAALRAGIDRGGRDDIVIVRRGSGPTDTPIDAEVWTLRTWWQSRGPEAWNAVSLNRIRDITVPVALIQAGNDPLLPSDEGEALADAARSAGVPVQLEHVPGADHTFWGLVPQAAERAVAWIDALPAGDAPAPARRSAPRSARLLTIEAEDGGRHDAMLEFNESASEQRARATGRRTALLMLHGNQGSMTVGTLRFLRGPITDSGIPVLTLDTRIGNVAQIFGTALLPDSLMDVRAAVRWLADDGFDHVIVAGYSLGASVAIHTTSHELGLPLLGVVCLGAAWSLPEATRARMEHFGAAPSYDELVELSRPHADSPAEQDTALVIHRMYLGDDAPHAAGVYTARSWWHSRGPEAEAAEAHLHIGGVAAPILLVQGTADEMVDPADAERLASQARGEGNADVTVAMLDGVGHDFRDHPRTIDAVRRWLVRVA